MYQQLGTSHHVMQIIFRSVCYVLIVKIPQIKQKGFAINQSFGKFLMLQQVVVVFAVADVRVVVPDTAASSSSSCCC